MRLCGRYYRALASFVSPAVVESGMVEGHHYSSKCLRLSQSLPHGVEVAV